MKKFTILLWGMLLVGQWASAADAGDIKWTIAVYSAGDEEEMGPYGEALVNEITAANIADNTEVLILHDAFEEGKDRRVILRPGAEASVESIDEFDAAAPDVLRGFIDWVDQNSTGDHRMLLVLGHSWGWKGIIQDYEIPSDPEKDTIMPLYQFAEILKGAKKKTDILMIDACVMGNAESIEELKGTANYMVVSQRETPFAGYPYQYLFDKLGDAELDVRTIAKSIPAGYAKAYSRHGDKTKQEREILPVTATVIDMEKWDHFANLFSSWVRTLRVDRKFREFLEKNPTYFERFEDEDSHVDVVELVKQVAAVVPSTREDANVTDAAAKIISLFNYPESIERWNSESIQISANADFSVEIQIDEMVEKKKFKDSFLKFFGQMNAEFVKPKDLKLEVLENDGVRTLVVRGKTVEKFQVRPWLPGTTWVKVTEVVDGNKFYREVKREVDYVIVDQFPKDSPIIAEAHTQGMAFQRGLGVVVNPPMDNEEERAEDPTRDLVGPELYRALEWNKSTGWGDLMLLN